MRIIEIFFRPPLAIARLGGADSPMDNFVWREDPTVHGAARNVIEPATTLEVLPDGSLSPFVPSVVRFRDRGMAGQLRPVAPFFEVWARVQRDEDETQADVPDELPLTSAVLKKAGADLSAVTYGIRLANRKAARRTRNESDLFSVWAKVAGDDFTPRPLLASSPQTPDGVPLVLPENPIPLGWFRVIRPVPGRVGTIDLDVLRVRYTPARGEVYGPPTAVTARDDFTGRTSEVVPAANRFLNGAASWVSYTGVGDAAIPQPWNTYDGAELESGRSRGVVDDTCDGVVTADVVVGGRRFSARARVAVSPPDYAPDRRPFASMADDLADRDLDPASVDALRRDEPDTQRRLADLFARVWETASLTNVDAIRFRALGDNDDVAAKAAKTRPKVNDDSMRPQDVPYADAKVEGLVPKKADRDSVALVFTTLVRLAHDQLAAEDELVDFIVNQPERLRLMIRPAYGTFHQFTDDAPANSEPDPGFRDPRRLRDQMHDMRMPPYMRDEISMALGLSHRQYTELMNYVGVVAAELEKAATGDGAEADAMTPALLVRQESVPVQTPLARRVRARLQQIHNAEQAR